MTEAKLLHIEETRAAMNGYMFIITTDLDPYDPSQPDEREKLIKSRSGSDLVPVFPDTYIIHHPATRRA